MEIIGSFREKFSPNRDNKERYQCIKDRERGRWISRKLWIVLETLGKKAISCRQPFGLGSLEKNKDFFPAIFMTV